MGPFRFSVGCVPWAAWSGTAFPLRGPLATAGLYTGGSLTARLDYLVGLSRHVGAAPMTPTGERGPRPRGRRAGLKSDAAWVPRGPARLTARRQLHRGDQGVRRTPWARYTARRPRKRWSAGLWRLGGAGGGWAGTKSTHACGAKLRSFSAGSSAESVRRLRSGYCRPHGEPGYCVAYPHLDGRKCWGIRGGHWELCDMTSVDGAG